MTIHNGLYSDEVNRILSFSENGSADPDNIVGALMMYDINKDLTKSVTALAF